MKKNILFCGTPNFAVASLKALFKYQDQFNYHLNGVITIPDKIAGRGQKMKESDVKKEAKKLNIPIFEPINLSDEKLINQIKCLNPDLLIVVAFRKLPKILFNIPKIGTINLHASLLPKYRGAAPINWSIVNGEKETGLTTFFINEKIDSGDIILQSKIKIPIHWHANDLHDKLMDESEKIIKKTIHVVFGENYNLKKQTFLTEPTAPKIKKQDRLLKIEEFEISKNNNSGIVKLYNFIRGMSPPGVKAEIEIQKTNKTIIQKTILITRVNNLIHTTTQKSEKLEIKHLKNSLIITNQKSSFQIEKLKTENGKEISAKEFINGFLNKDCKQIAFTCL